MRSAPRILAALTAVVLCAFSPTQATAQAPAGNGSQQSGTVAVRCGELHLGDGRVLRDVWLEVQNGRVARIGAAAPAQGIRRIDASDKVVVPGLVAADSDIGDNINAEPYAITPDALAIDSYDLFEEYDEVLAGGVTTAWISPTRSRLVGGQGAVVKLAGDDLDRRILSETAALRIAMGDPGLEAPTVFEPTIAPTDDDPLVGGEPSGPRTRIAQLAKVRELFQQAQLDPNGAYGSIMVENTYSLTPLRDVLDGQLPLRIAAANGADIGRALVLAGELGAYTVLEDAWGIRPLAPEAARRGVAAVYRLAVRPGAANPGGETIGDERQRPDPEAPGIAARAGIKVALAPAQGAPWNDFLLSAGIAVRHGFPADQALPAITLHAAELLGVADRVGSLAVGKDGDFLILTGAPFAVGTLVQETWMNGELAWERETESSLLAVRVGKVMTGTGERIEDGVVLIENGRILAVGSDLAVPFGAKVLDLPDGVMTPGLIDAYSHLGLASYGRGLPAGSPDQDPAAAVVAGDPLLQKVAKAGITTVLVSGVDRGPVSGRVSALKTGGPEADRVVNSIAGVRFVHSQAGSTQINRLRTSLGRGKAYRERWLKHEKALAEWEKGNKEKAKELQEEANEGADDTPAEGPDPISGVWELDIEAPIPVPLTVVLKLKLSGSKVTGTATPSIGPRQAESVSLEGTFQDGTLKLTLSTPNGPVECEFKVDGETMTGTFPLGRRPLPASGTRTSTDPGSMSSGGGGTRSRKNKDGRPEEPPFDPALEPIKALYDGTATAVIRTSDAVAIGEVVKLFTKEKLRFALHGAREATLDDSVLGDTKPIVLFEPGFVRKDDGRWENDAATMVQAGLKVAIGTGDAAGSAYLGLHASHGVRYGLDPQAALAAITSVPAEAFGIGDRVGSLQKGRDGDLVVFDGDPFQPTSRVLLVVVGGEVVFNGQSEQKD